MAKNRLAYGPGQYEFIVKDRNFCLWRIRAPNPRAALEKARRLARIENLPFDFIACYWRPEDTTRPAIRVSVGHNDGAATLWQNLLNDRT